MHVLFSLRGATTGLLIVLCKSAQAKISKKVFICRHFVPTAKSLSISFSLSLLASTVTSTVLCYSVSGFQCESNCWTRFFLPPFFFVFLIDFFYPPLLFLAFLPQLLSGRLERVDGALLLLWRPSLVCPFLRRAQVGQARVFWVLLKAERCNSELPAACLQSPSLNRLC